VTRTVESPWYTREEAANYLRVSPDTLDRLNVARSRLGDTRRLLFHRDDLDATVIRTDAEVVSND
jgi:hypothetical protein